MTSRCAAPCLQTLVKPPPHPQTHKTRTIIDDFRQRNFAYLFPGITRIDIGLLLRRDSRKASHSVTYSNQRLCAYLLSMQELAGASSSQPLHLKELPPKVQTKRGYPPSVLAGWSGANLRSASAGHEATTARENALAFTSPPHDQALSWMGTRWLCLRAEESGRAERAMPTVSRSSL